MSAMFLAEQNITEVALALQMSGALQRSEHAVNDAGSGMVGSSSTGIQAQS